MSDLQTKIGGGLNILQDSLQQGKQKLQTVQEISQLKKLIQENDEKRANLIFQLGEDTYRKIRSGELQDPQLRKYFLEIAEIDRNIFQGQASLEQIKQKADTRECSNCGASIGADDKFCGVCGQQQAEPLLLKDSSQLATCPTCEQSIPLQAKFCPCCGSRLSLLGGL